MVLNLAKEVAPSVEMYAGLVMKTFDCAYICKYSTDDKRPPPICMSRRPRLSETLDG